MILKRLWKAIQTHLKKGPQNLHTKSKQENATILEKHIIKNLPNNRVLLNTQEYQTLTKPYEIHPKVANYQTDINELETIWNYVALEEAKKT